MSELDLDCTVPTSDGFVVANRAEVFDDNDAISDRVSHPAITPRFDWGWVVGRYVGTDFFNTNGHYFPHVDVLANMGRIEGTPLDVAHQSKFIVGTFRHAEMIDKPPSDQVVDPYDEHSYVRTVSNFYKNVHPDVWGRVRSAQDLGTAWMSQQCIPDRLTCATEGCCGDTYRYDGVRSEKYCSSLNKPRARKILHNPRFVSGALVIPPHRPGWDDADITAVSSLVEANPTIAEDLYNRIAGELDHLGPREWEWMMAALLAQAHGDTELPERPLVVPGWRPEPDGVLPARRGDPTDVTVCARIETDGGTWTVPITRLGELDDAHTVHQATTEGLEFAVVDGLLAEGWPDTPALVDALHDRGIPTNGPAIALSVGGDPAGFELWWGPSRFGYGLAAPADDETIEVPVPGVPVAAGLAVKARDTRRVLMLQRSNDDDTDPARGTWEFPGGKIEPDEAPLDAAKREWAEEIGTPLPDGDLGRTWITPNGVYQGFVHWIDREDQVPINLPSQQRTVKDPDGDLVETTAWWYVDQLRTMGDAMRAELRRSRNLWLGPLSAEPPDPDDD